MKKQYFFALGLMIAGLTASAQTNLVVNGNAETWTGGNAENFEPHQTQNYINHFITQGTTVHGGNFSIKHQSQSSSQYLEYGDLIEVVPGHSYTISYWFLDNDDKARTRIWSSWIQQVGTQYNALPDHEPELRYADQNLSYSTDNPNWIQKTVTLTAPANATHFRYQIRTYRQSSSAEGGYIYYDDLSFVDNSANSTKDNAIAGLKMFPNPLNGEALNITSDANATKTVTVFDVLGKQVINTTTDNGVINTSNLTSGVYVVKITEDGKTATRKLVVQ